MPSDIAALLDNPAALTAVLFVGALIGMAVERAISVMRRRAWRRRRPAVWARSRGENPLRPDRWRANLEALRANRPPDAADQLRVVMDAKFTSRPLLNRSETRVFKELNQIVIGCNPAWQVMAQVSLGEILRTDDAQAYSCINAKRVDLLLVDEHCKPRLVVEYQGRAHHQGTAAARDAVKKEALRRAGIGYHEVIAGQTKPYDLRRLVERLVEPTAEHSQHQPTTQATALTRAIPPAGTVV